ncbi:MAG TPA: MFS transporter [Xanthobacteraceae bacterium]|jgi:predicted MFS family arabinose efflux permease
MMWLTTPDPTPQGGGERTEPDPVPAKPSQRSLRGLDWFVFFVSTVLTGFGPFVAVYLTSQHWTQLDIGLVLSIGGLASLLGQMPSGALVDAARSERLVAGLAVAATAASALALGLWPIYPIVQVASVVQALAGCVLGPAIAAISLGLVGHDGLGERLGRNARFASLGTGFGAAAMGASGYLLGDRAVFFVAAAFVLPGLFALRLIEEKEVDPERAHGGIEDEPCRHHHAVPVLSVIRNRALLIFAACVLLFQLANAAMLPLLAGILTMRSSQWATALIAACMIVPQLIVALVSPWVGRSAQRIGRRPLLLVGMAVVSLRGILFASLHNPFLLVAVQLLDGIAAAVFTVLTPFIIADITRGTGRFNLSLGIVGTGTGIGASLSTTAAGYSSDHFGSPVAFLALAAFGAAGLLLVWAAMPETRPPKQPYARKA